LFKTNKMDASEFKKVANELHKTCNSNFNEGLCRTAISRYYYYTFLNIREIISSEDEFHGKKLEGGRSHGFIKNYLESFSNEIQNPKFGAVASLMEELHDLRKEADYNLKQLNIDKLIEAERLSKVINDKLEKIKFCNNEGFKNILNYLKAQDGLKEIDMKEKVRYCRLDHKKICPCSTSGTTAK